MDTITSYKDFILNSIPEIRQFNQRSFCWRTDGKGREYVILTEMKAKHKDFAETIGGLGDGLDREAVSKCYKEDFYTGFIATLLWGGYHKSRFNQLKTVLSVGKNDIEKNIAKVDKMLSENRIQDAFLALESGDCHIKGIGTSYLIKILYFLGKGKSLPEQPLIFDSIQTRTHAALLIDDRSVSVKEYYAPSLRGLKKPVELYMDYIQRVNQISKNYKLEADRLEAFLFGSDIRRKKGAENPRLITRDFVKRYI